MEDIRECEVCGETKQVFVGSSALGAISFARCAECIIKQLEPYWMIVANAAICDYPNGCAEWFLEYIDYCLKEFNISKDKFKKDIERENKKIDNCLK